MTKEDLEGASVLVTGGAGFIGSHLVDALIEFGARVRVLDNLSTGLASNLDHCRGGIDFVEGDLRAPADCKKACNGVGLVFHQAALGSVPRSMKDPATSIHVNVVGTTNIFAAARDAGVHRVVYASSSSVYGDSAKLPKKEGEEGQPLSPYALSKSMNEQLASVFASNYGMSFVGLRYFNVYGPRQRPDGAYAAVIPRFFHAGLAGETPMIHGDGAQSRDFTFVADAVKANILAAIVDAEGSFAVNVAGGNRTTVSELARLVLDKAGSSILPEHGPPRAGDVRHSLADLSRVEDLLGYQPSTDLAEGLTASLQHYRSTFATT